MGLRHKMSQDFAVEFGGDGTWIDRSWEDQQVRLVGRSIECRNWLALRRHAVTVTEHGAQWANWGRRVGLGGELPYNEPVSHLPLSHWPVAK
jgi:hypothetical protein